MHSVGTAATRNSQAWVRDLSHGGEVQAIAIGELSALLRWAALFTLSRSVVSGRALAPAQAEQIAETSTRESIALILKRLPELRPESRFTTWAYKFVVQQTLATARAARGEQPLAREKDSPTREGDSPC
jgi:RNA polymerase sigma-70 factor (ECF subfamily)